VGRNETSHGGGIGAALSHYTVSQDGVSTSGDHISHQLRSLSKNDPVRGGRMVDASGVYLSRNSKRNEMGARGISPLLLPPPGIPSSIVEPPDMVRPDDRQLSSRLLPRDYKAGSAFRGDGGSSRSLTTSSGSGYVGRGLPPHNIMTGEFFTDPVS
jgi:hypothetical protein